MQKVLHETCEQYVARRLSEGWRIISQIGFNIILQSPEGIIRPVDLRNDVETLRPNAAGDATNIASQYPDSNYHWAKVDEASADSDTTYIYTSSPSWQGDLYNLPAHSGSGTINSVKIYVRCRKTDVSYGGYARARLKSNSTITEGTTITLTTSYVTSSQQWDTNPADSAVWEWADIDALQIGVSLYGSSQAAEYCTQVYVEVDYTVVKYIPPRGYYPHILAH